MYKELLKNINKQTLTMSRESKYHYFAASSQKDEITNITVKNDCVYFSCTKSPMMKIRPSRISISDESTYIEFMDGSQLTINSDKTVKFKENLNPTVQQKYSSKYEDESDEIYTENKNIEKYKNTLSGVKELKNKETFKNFVQYYANNHSTNINLKVPALMGYKASEKDKDTFEPVITYLTNLLTQNEISGFLDYANSLTGYPYQHKK